MPAIIVRGSKIFDAVTILAGDAATSEPVSLESANAVALHLTSIAGTSPSVTFTYSLSADGETFVVPQSPAVIGATKSAVDVMDFAPECARLIKIIATNNSEADAVEISAVLAIQDLE